MVAPSRLLHLPRGLVRPWLGRLIPVSRRRRLGIFFVLFIRLTLLLYGHHKCRDDNGNENHDTRRYSDDSSGAETIIVLMRSRCKITVVQPSYLIGRTADGQKPRGRQQPLRGGAPEEAEPARRPFTRSVALPGVVDLRRVVPGPVPLVEVFPVETGPGNSEHRSAGRPHVVDEVTLFSHPKTPSRNGPGDEGRGFTELDLCEVSSTHTIVHRQCIAAGVGDHEGGGTVDFVVEYNLPQVAVVEPREKRCPAVIKRCIESRPSVPQPGVDLLGYFSIHPQHVSLEGLARGGLAGLGCRVDNIVVQLSRRNVRPPRPCVGAGYHKAQLIHCINMIITSPS
eukprot:Hpha_TRINITY_DN22755_c0_g1::TRINITY_DN22755_c0_g1_i1::g.34200::m.34200